MPYVIHLLFQNSKVPTSEKSLYLKIQRVKEKNSRGKKKKKKEDDT